MELYNPERLAKLINAGRAADLIVRVAELETLRKEAEASRPLLLNFPGNPEPVGVPNTIAGTVIGAIIAALEKSLEDTLAETRN
ncbi:hypothetical protein SAMN06295937_100754 [Sphingopyxis flava]|uniref:Uncharacterized protein n=1 Tax=Sphingopyxis flava TaxID=1507287 RepID=A0A1T5BQ59_9SPHN|nr:hypothetical protein SAMN06295937_100754 [Sphingopyxis flava]